MTNVLEIIGRPGCSEILNQLRTGSKSYSEITEKVEISSKTLVSRLKELTDAGLIKRDLRKNRRVFYHITRKGIKVVRLIEEFKKIG